MSETLIFFNPSWSFQDTTIKQYKIMSKYGFSFSLSRLLGIAQAKQKFARTTGIPTTKGGMQRKIGASILKMFFK
jgi:hypothetical protein